MQVLVLRRVLEFLFRHHKIALFTYLSEHGTVILDILLFFVYFFLEEVFLFVNMSSLCIRSSRLFLRTLFNSKTCVRLPLVRQIGRVQASAESLRGVTKLVGVSSCVAVGAGLAGFLTSVAFYNPDVVKLHAKGADDRPRAPSQWNFIADVVEKVSPAVVYIEIEARLVCSHHLG